MEKEDSVGKECIRHRVCLNDDEGNVYLEQAENGRCLRLGRIGQTAVDRLSE